MNKIGIVGLGQIGGSIALGLRRAGIRPYGLDPRVRKLPPLPSAGLDLLILACPVPAILQVLDQLSRQRHLPRIVTDVGSVKAPVVKAMARLPKTVQWVGGHPLAGTEGRGWESASPDLFKGATWVLTQEHRGAGKVARLVRLLGARVETLPAVRHDRILARTSHAPYLVACAMVRAALAEGLKPAELRRFSAGGWRDMTRLALSDPGMAGGYAQANLAEVRKALRALSRELGRIDPKRLQGMDRVARRVRR